MVDAMSAFDPVADFRPLLFSIRLGPCAQKEQLDTPDVRESAHMLSKRSMKIEGEAAKHTTANVTWPWTERSQLQGKACCCSLIQPGSKLTQEYLAQRMTELFWVGNKAV